MSAATIFPLQPVRAAEPFSSLLQKRAQGRAKRGRRKVVSWPSEDQICQIRFFLSNDAPSTLGPAQDVLQVNHVRSLSTQSVSWDRALDTPPGFHAPVAKRVRVNNASMAIERPWLRPQKYVYDCEWLVADGDESKEAGLQQQREPRVLEAFYPRLTCIPDSPAEPVEICKGLDNLDDHLILTIPLVSIEEEDESSKESEYDSKVLEGNCNSDLAIPEHGNVIDDRKHQLPTSRGSLPPMQESGKHWQESPISEVDPKVAASAAAAAAFMAVHKFGADGLVDQELLAGILRNPALLKNFTFNPSPKDLVQPINGHEVGTVGQPNKSHSNVNQCVGPFIKACQKVPLNAGLPSPVSVLSDWMEEHPAKLFSRIPSNLSEISNKQNFANASSSVPLLLKHTCSPYPTKENVAQLESTPVQTVHTCTQEALSASHIPNASAHTTSNVYVDRSCGMVTPLTPFPSQNVANFNSSLPGKMQSAQVLKAPVPTQIGVMHHKHVSVIENGPCRGSFSDARFRGMQNDNSGLGLTKAGLGLTKAGSKTTRLCMYFNTPRGCRYGGNCAFVHQSVNPELSNIAQ